MYENINPDNVKPTAGNVLVQILEQLGGKTAGGLWTVAQDHAGKDTFYGKIIRVGPAPCLAHYKTGDMASHGVRPNKNGTPWPDAIMSNFEEGALLVLPRDVPRVFVWNNERYAVCHIHEAIAVIAADDFDPTQFEVVPWVPPVVA